MTPGGGTAPAGAAGATGASGAAEPALHTVQSLIWPDPGLRAPDSLFLRLDGPARVSGTGRALDLEPGGRVRTDSWFNLFNAGKWRRHCGLQSLHLALDGAGAFDLEVLRAVPGRAPEPLIRDSVTLPLRLDMSAALEGAGGESLLFFDLRATGAGGGGREGGAGVLRGADWQTADAPRRRPDLVAAVTTFRREAEAVRMVDRFRAWAAQSPLRDRVRLVVVDNGRTLDIAGDIAGDGDRVTVIRNENLGGAGGFARGLLAARDAGASHCLFMDDDASVHMDSLDRTWRFLAFAANPATAVAGAMIDARERWRVWENGAVFHTRCRPLFQGTDLRAPDAVRAMEFATTGPVPANFYGGWWFFAFPLAHVRHLPFPFFVRGDDVSFSLAHDFDMVRLAGVASFQDSFTGKESPLTWYLDLRSHMAHHLALAHMEAGRLGCLRVAVWFFARTLPRMHYETLAAVSMALEDVMAGPEFFAENADMARRRAEIGALTDRERWRPVPPDAVFAPERDRAPPWWYQLAMWLSLNGHLLPFFARYGARATIPARLRGKVSVTAGAARLTYLSADRAQYYTVTHSKAEFARQSWRFLRASARFLAGYRGLRDRWRAGYGRLTAESWWRARLAAAGELPATPPATPDD